MKRLLFTFVLALTFCAETFFDDWPQWRNSDLSGVSKETGLLKEASSPQLCSRGPPICKQPESSEPGFLSLSASAAIIVEDPISNFRPLRQGT